MKSDSEKFVIKIYLTYQNFQKKWKASGSSIVLPVGNISFLNFMIKLDLDLYETRKQIMTNIFFFQLSISKLYIYDYICKRKTIECDICFYSAILCVEMLACSARVFSCGTVSLVVFLSPKRKNKQTKNNKINNKK